MRAMAISAVVIYHSFPNVLPGGFLGVDVFFVLSGFLISRLIIFRDAQLEGKRLSLKCFYAQRAKRLLPMLFVTMVLVWGIAWSRFFPDQLQDLGSATFATILTFANVHFAGKTGYFDTSAESSPLLHTWSLSVEEQFYFLFPVLFLFFWRRRVSSARWISWLAAWAVLGWVLSCVLTHQSPLQGFFGLPSRAWEMLAGVVVALLEHRGVSAFNRASFLAIAGLILCVGSFFLCNKESIVPGPLAVVPVLGTTLLLWTRMGGPGSNLWSFWTWEPIRYLGRLSYSFYLLHWPILVFWKFSYNASPWAALGTALLLTVALHHTVENPIRACRNPAVLRLMLRGGVFLGFSLLGFSKWVRIHEGFVNAPTQSWFESVLPDAQRRRATKTSLVPMGTSQGVPEVLLIGDSHAESLFREMDKGLKSMGKSGVFWWAPGTFPGKGVLTSVYSRQFERDLPMLAQGPWRTVILCSNWGGYLDFENHGSRVIKLKNPFQTHEQAFSIIERGLVDTLRSFSPRRVVLINQIPLMNWDVPIEMTKWLMQGKSLPESWIPEESARHDTVNRLMEIAEKHASVVVDPLSTFSKNGRLRYQDNQQSLYRDAGHLSDRGASELIPILLKQLETPLGAPQKTSP
jgi:peptidoglycan/LPS O-acetylase OafA/YrhL